MNFGMVLGAVSGFLELDEIEKNSELLDFERDIPTTPEDIRALEEHRPRAGEDWLLQLEELSKQFPVSPEDLARRPTFEGYEPFEL